MAAVVELKTAETQRLLDSPFVDPVAELVDRTLKLALDLPVPEHTPVET